MKIFSNRTDHPELRLVRVVGEGSEHVFAGYNYQRNTIFLNACALKDLTDDGIEMVINHELCHWSQLLFCTKTEFKFIEKSYITCDKTDKQHILERAMPDEYREIKIIHFKSIFEMFKRSLGINF